MKIELTKGQINEIWKKLTDNEAVELLGLTPNASLEVVCKFIYLYMHQGWQKKKLQETLDATPTQIELFPEQIRRLNRVLRESSLFRWIVTGLYDLYGTVWRRSSRILSKMN